ncbi:MAG: OB-fold domain-containing protein [Chloroflexi bacterium]|nr:OB-fold domain-containing protein [Chloroflexota bacterium]
MVTGSKRQIPIREGLWTTPTSPDEKPQLIGSRCPSCGEVFFPKNDRCLNCQHTPLKEIKLSRRGKIFSISTVMQAPPKYYKGRVPYAIGYVELPDGVRVLTSFADDPEPLKVGTEVELVIEKVGENEAGDELMGFKFKAVQP